MAVHRAIGGRDPLPYPRLESDESFVGKRASKVNNNINKNSYIKQKC